MCVSVGDISELCITKKEKIKKKKRNAFAGEPGRQLNKPAAASGGRKTRRKDNNVYIFNVPMGPPKIYTEPLLASKKKIIATYFVVIEV